MDADCPPPVVDYERLVDAMGYWPSFHDAHVLSACREGDQCRVVIHVFRMTSDVNEDGFFRLADHHRVTLLMIGVSDCSLPASYEPDVLMELVLGVSGDSVTVGFESVMDQDWQATCSEVRLVDVAPCGPRGV